MTLRCKTCNSRNVRQEWAALIDPNDDDCMKNFDPTTLDYNDFEYCLDCEDVTDTYEDAIPHDPKDWPFGP